MKPFLFLITLLFLPNPLPAGEKENEQAYLWPTDASQYLTSAFGEYRPRRYHTGIDIKTWGKTGYNVFAIRPGYVWRISVSPYGYGKALYLKLDSGEIAVFAHLSKFSDEIEEMVWAEQERLGRYRVNMFLKPGVLPVGQGEIIAYTGRTGIGAPHLHFEIRDAGNRPLNPLSKYQVVERVSPIIQKISFTPLDENSEVNRDYRPVVLIPDWVGPSEYIIREPVTIWGNVGLAVAAYDKSKNALNRYGAYRLTLYIDGALRFQYQYDEISFQENPMVEHERDYRLSRRQQGRFHKLYKDKYNQRSGYFPNHKWAGVLSSVSLDTAPNLQSKNRLQKPVRSEPDSGDLLFPGSYSYKIEVSDFNGNTSVVHGRVNIGAAFDIFPQITTGNNEIILNEIATYNLTGIESLEIYALRRKQWQLLPLNGSRDEMFSPEKGGAGKALPQNSYETVLSNEMLRGTPVLKLVGKDPFGIDSYPSFFVNSKSSDLDTPPSVTLNYDFYDTYTRLTLNATTILHAAPEITLNPFSKDSVKIVLHQTDLKKYVGRLSLSHLKGTNHVLRISTTDASGDSYSRYDEFEMTRIPVNRKGNVMSKDGICSVTFWSGSLFDPVFTRINLDSSTSNRGYDLESPVYDVHPGDVLLKEGAMVHLQYPDSASNPDKLGVYYRNGRGRWIFIDNRHDVSKRTVSARVLSFEKFALIRDEVGPKISAIRPRNNARLRYTPKLSIYVEDRLSGIASEKDIEIRLNGELVIAEYDPERDRLSYQFRESLNPGHYKLTLAARDKCNNVSMKETSFQILP